MASSLAPFSSESLPGEILDCDRDRLRAQAGGGVVVRITSRRDTGLRLLTRKLFRRASAPVRITSRRDTGLRLLVLSRHPSADSNRQNHFQARYWIATASFGVKPQLELSRRSESLPGEILDCDSDLDTCTGQRVSTVRITSRRDTRLRQFCHR